MTRDKRIRTRFPYLSAVVLAVIICGCILSGVVMPHDSTLLDPMNANASPSSEYLFGTDALGRDIFSMIWYGGRVSLAIGLLSAAISAVIAVLYGCVSAVAPDSVDGALTRAAELLMSMPSILTVIFVQAVIGKSGVMSLALVIGVTGWMGMARVVRAEVRQLSRSGYIEAARAMHAGFFHILRRHILPNLIPSTMFMVVTSVGTAIATEATLSFLGLGLPMETPSWGVLLSQADRAMLSGSWWAVVIPGVFLVATILSITGIGNFIRGEEDKKCSYL